MTLKAAFWRTSLVVLLVVMIGAAVPPAFFGPHPERWALLIPVAVVLVCWLRMLPIRMEVTDALVRAKQGRWRGQPDMEVPRSEISGIHYFPTVISFRGLDNKPIMKLVPHWSLRQILKVATELDVRLYDHRGFLGLKSLSIGRLVYDPASGLLARRK
jgi:hypothetical protein